jgi:hypothetical protein
LSTSLHILPIITFVLFVVVDLYLYLLLVLTFFAINEWELSRLILSIKWEKDEFPILFHISCENFRIEISGFVILRLSSNFLIEISLNFLYQTWNLSILLIFTFLVKILRVKWKDHSDEVSFNHRYNYTEPFMANCLVVVWFEILFYFSSFYNYFLSQYH